MLDFLLENIASIVIAVIIAALVTAVIIKIVRDKKKGRSSCGGNCSACRGCQSKK